MFSQASLQLGVSPHTPVGLNRHFSIVWDDNNLVLDLHDELEGECADNPDVAKPARIHHAPTQAEIDEHEVTHYPWRAWCSCCVRGAAIFSAVILVVACFCGAGICGAVIWGGCDFVSWRLSERLYCPHSPLHGLYNQNDSLASAVPRGSNLWAILFPCERWSPLPRRIVTES